MGNDDNKKQQVDDELEEREGEENAQIAELEEKIVELDNKYRRALADYQNLEKRVREERGEWIKSANQQLQH